jgi:arginyl-tRNA synthetase
MPKTEHDTALARVERALAAVAETDVRLERPSNPEHGDYATNVALQLARLQRRPPLEIAADLRDAAEAVPGVADAAVAKPGFLNLVMSREWYASALAEMLEAGKDYGSRSARARERVQVELISANPTGPLTVGSGRNGAYGDSVARLLEFAGNEVEREYYVNDLGAQIELFRDSVDARRRGDEPPDGGYLGEYVRELAELPGDPVEHMLERIKATVARFRIDVDAWVRQSEIERELDEALAALPLYEEGGAKWLRTTEHGDDKDRVVVRSDGRPTYFAADAPHIRHKYELGFDRLVYVLGADHHGYVGRLKALAAAYGHDPESVEALIYQLVHLIRHGETTKVSKRRGDVVLLDELIDEIGVDAARWYLVSRGHEQTIELDIDLARERSEKNPVYYVQYAHARIAGILRNAGEAEASPEPLETLAGEERDLVKRLAEFPSVAAEAAERRAPHAITTFAIRVADDFHRFYHHHRVLESEEQAFRLALCRATQGVIGRCLDLVGVEAPERM